MSITPIDKYIAEQAEVARPLLQKIREAVRSAAPNATEKISYQMPTFWQGKNIIYFAVCKSHIGIYPGPVAIEAFAERLTDYKTSKGAIQLPLEKPIDYKLIADIVRWKLQKQRQT
jgi:uncharacterized protein YdhG (YjbR/CyaY superfamily)